MRLPSRSARSAPSIARHLSRRTRRGLLERGGDAGPYPRSARSSSRLPSSGASSARSSGWRRHLGAFGEIKITRLEPERTVAWEGEGASGTVSIEPSGWGTKVVLTAHASRARSRHRARAGARAGARRGGPGSRVNRLYESGTRCASAGWLRRLFGWEPRRDRPVESARVGSREPGRDPEPEPEPEPRARNRRARAGRRGASPRSSTATAPRPRWRSALEALGSAHHRPFSRG